MAARGLRVLPSGRAWLQVAGPPAWPYASRNGGITENQHWLSPVLTRAGHDVGGREAREAHSDTSLPTEMTANVLALLIALTALAVAAGTAVVAVASRRWAKDVEEGRREMAEWLRSDGHRPSAA